MVSILGACALLVTGGCAGPKAMSNHQSQSRAWHPLPSVASVSIRPSSEGGSGEMAQSTALRQTLAAKLVASGVFRTVDVGGGAEYDPILVIDVTRVTRAGWGNRAFAVGARSSVRAEGKLISSNQSVIATISEMRSAQGGIVGAGGWITCGEESMITALRNWVAEDICDSLKEQSRSGGAK